MDKGVKKIAGKRGTHIGIIASFSIFVLFLVVLYAILEPAIVKEKEKELAMAYLEVKLLGEFSENLTIALIKPNSTGCMSLNYADLGINSSTDSVIKDKNNNILNSGKNSNFLFIENSAESVLWVYYSFVNFSDTLSVSGTCYYPRIESIRENKQIFEEKISDAVSNFQQLKDELKITPGVNFGFSFEMENKTVIGNNKINTSLDVFSKEIPIQYYNNKAEKLNGKIRIMVW